MAGRVADALENEALTVRLSGMDALSVAIEVRARVAHALSHNRRNEEAARLFNAALELGRAKGGALDCDLPMAALSHNLANDLMYRPERSAVEDELMLQCAQAGREFFGRCGNDQHKAKAELMLAQVHNELQRPDDALGYVQAGLKFAEGSPLDGAMLQLAAAKSQKMKEDKAAYEQALAAADKLAEGIEHPGMQAWYKQSRAE
jgi:tetratricopeptide (TPR) repeat protein